MFRGAGAVSLPGSPAVRAPGVHRRLRDPRPKRGQAGPGLPQEGRDATRRGEGQDKDKAFPVWPRRGRSPGHKGLFLRTLTGTFFKGLEVITRWLFLSEGRYVLLSLSPHILIFACFCRGTPPHHPLFLLANVPPGC